IVRNGQLDVAHEGAVGTQGALRTNRLPGLTAADPSRHNGHASRRKLSIGRSSSACAFTGNAIFPPLRSINAPAATTLPPISRTTLIASSVDPPVVQTSSTTRTR